MYAAQGRLYHGIYPWRKDDYCFAKGAESGAPAGFGANVPPRNASGQTFANFLRRQ